MAIDIHDFSGIAPALTPWKLPKGMAQIAQNINPDSRTVKPWKDAVTVANGLVLLAGVTITGTAGQFSCTAATLAIGKQITISGTFGGTGSISGYANPTNYWIIATNGSTTFTLSASPGGAAITTTAGTPTGLTYNLQTFVASGITTIFRFGRSLVSDTQYWFQWGYDVDVVKGPVVGDTTERTFWTGQGAPKWTNATLAIPGGPPYPQAYRDLGVIAPSAAPTVVVTLSPTSTDYMVAGYAYTHVTAYGEESAPSPISTPQKVYPGQTVTISGFVTPPSGNSSVVSRRFYRSVTSGTDTNLYFLQEMVLSNTYSFDDYTHPVGGVIPTTGWNPPSSTMFGITAMANGIMVGFDGYDVCVSAQYAPYAWPPQYKLSTDFPIVGGKAIGNQVVVLTMGNPYLLSGSTSDALSLTKIESPEACVSKRSIVNITSPMPSMMGPPIMVGTVYYASQNGLCSCDSQGAVKVVTAGILNRDDWQALSPTSINGFAYNGRYFGFFNTGTVQGGFCFDPHGDQAALTLFPFYATGGFMDIVQDHLLLQVGTNIVLWNSSTTALTGTWRSGIFETPMKTFWGAAVLARSYGGAVTFNLYGDGILIQSVVVPSARAFRVNCDDKHFQWEIEIVTTVEVYEVVLADSAQDMIASGNT
jgi:hypothetical protein